MNGALKVTFPLTIFPFHPRIFRSVAPIVPFNQTSLANISFSSPISNLSLFFNTLHSNGTLFELVSSLQRSRFARDIRTKIWPASKIIGALIDGRFRLIIIDDGPKRQEFELRSEQKLNDGLPHQVQLDLDHYRLIIDQIYNETLTNTNHRLTPNEIDFLGDGSLNGWLQDVRINDRLIPFDKNRLVMKDFNLTVLNMNPSANNPCYPNNPCRNQGVCSVTTSQEYR